VIYWYLDFQKAFHTIPHKRLLCKLASFGVQGQLLKWIEKFLTNRQQQAILNGQLSHTAFVINGVPQGSILGPLLLSYHQ